MDEEQAFQAWWADLVRHATVIVEAHDPPATHAKIRLAAHAYVEGQQREIKDATAKANARAEQLRAELKRRRRD